MRKGQGEQGEFLNLDASQRSVSHARYEPLFPDSLLVLQGCHEDGNTDCEKRRAKDDKRERPRYPRREKMFGDEGERQGICIERAREEVKV